MEPLTDVRDISRIAYGFIASKALFAALELDLFSRLLEPKSIDALARESGIPARRVKTLLATLTALGLIVRDGDRFHNSPASERYLTRGSPAYFGEYYRLQVNRQLYPALEHLDAGLAGDASNRGDEACGLDLPHGLNRLLHIAHTFEVTPWSRPPGLSSRPCKSPKVMKTRAAGPVA